MKPKIKRLGKNRGCRWMVVYSNDTEPRRKYFKTKEAAVRFAGEHDGSFPLSADHMESAVAGRVAAGKGYTIGQLIKAGLEHLQNSGAPTNFPECPHSNASHKGGTDL